MVFLIFQKTHFLLHFRVKKVEKIGQKLNFRRFWWNLHTNCFWPRSFTWWGSFCVETTFYGVFGVLKLICQGLRNRPKIAFFDWFSSDSRLNRLVVCPQQSKWKRLLRKKWDTLVLRAFAPWRLCFFSVQLWCQFCDSDRYSDHDKCYISHISITTDRRTVIFWPVLLRTVTSLGFKKVAFSKKPKKWL